MVGFFKFVIALVAVVFYTSNGQPFWKEFGKLESAKQYFQLPWRWRNAKFRSKFVPNLQ